MCKSKRKVEFHSGNFLKQKKDHFFQVCVDFKKGAVISITYDAGVENHPCLCYVAMILSINGVLSTICSLTPTTNFVHFSLVDGKKSKKLFVTMVIRNVTLNDDSTYGALGRYECHAFAVGDPVESKHGFYVNVILSKYNCILFWDNHFVYHHFLLCTVHCSL